MDFLNPINELIQSSEIHTERSFVIAAVMYILAKIFLCLAVKNHSKINHVKYGNLWTSAALFLSPIITAIYFGFNKHFPHKVPVVCASCGKKPPRGRTKCPHCGGTHFVPAQYENIGGLKNKIIVFLAIGIALTAVSAFIVNYESASPEDVLDLVGSELSENEDFLHFDFDGKYYDTKGIEYTDNFEVPYYDSDGNEYIYDAIEGLVRNDGSGIAVPFDMALVDNEGYLSVGKFETVPNVVPFKTQDGKTYYWAKDVSWDKDGNLIYSSNGEKVAE